MILAALLLQTVAPLPPRLDHCYRTERQGDEVVEVYVGDRACVPLKAPLIYDGIWIDEFEGQNFVEGATSVRTLNRDQSTPWFATDDPVEPFVKPAPLNKAARFGRNLYRVRFIRRQAIDMHRKPPFGYGHMGSSEGLILLDKMLSIAPLRD